jgi:GcrA cell cycle regulator
MEVQAMTTERNRLFTELWTSRVPAAEIAARLGLAKRTVFRKAGRLKLPRRFTRALPAETKGAILQYLKAGEKHLAIAAATGVSLSSVKKTARDNGITRPRTAADERKMNIAVKTMAEQGLLYSEIGNRLGVSKNAVIGRATRMGLRRRVRSPTPPPGRALLADLDDYQCRFPFGNPGEEGFGFCGAPVAAGKPYCPEHCERAYQARQGDE